MTSSSTPRTCWTRWIAATKSSRPRRGAAAAREAAQSGAVPALEEYQAIAALLAEAENRARRNCTDKAADVADPRSTIQPMLEALAKAWPLLTAARAAQAQADWKASAEQYAAAVAAMGALSACAKHRGKGRHAEGRHSRTAVGRCRRSAAPGTRMYQAGASGKLSDIDFGGLFTEISNCLNAIAEVKKTVEPAPAVSGALTSECAVLPPHGHALREAYERERSDEQHEALRILSAPARDQFRKTQSRRRPLRVLRETLSESPRPRRTDLERSRRLSSAANGIRLLKNWVRPRTWS